MNACETGATPLYLLPGLICSDVVWRFQVEALADYAPVAVRGYGNANSLPAMADIVLAECPARISLAGHSMGARVALEMYRRSPERIERIALLDTGVHTVAPGEKEKRMALMDLGRQEGMSALVDAWLPPMVHPDRRHDEEFLAPLRKMCLDAGLAQFECQVEALLTRPEVRSLLPDIRCPALVGVGSDDAWASPDQHRRIAADMRDAELVIFEHAGHMAPCEEPEQVSDALLRLLNRPVIH